MIGSREGGPPVAFVIAGVQKAGTTALAHYLGRHPQLFLPAAKELHFFNNDRLFEPPGPDYSRYHQHFQGAGPGQLLGEATPAYIYWRPVVPRMHAYNPDLRIIVILRNPIERAFSHWNMERRRGQEELSLTRALELEEERLDGAAMEQSLIFSYRDRGYYAEQLRRLWQWFPPEQTVVLRTEWLWDDPGGTVGAVCRLLGVSELQGLQRERLNACHYEEGFPLAAWERLVDAYYHDIRQLERLLGWDCSAWLTRPGE